MIQRVSIVVGAPLAGWVVAAHGLAIGFTVCAAFFTLSVLVLVTMRMLALEHPTAGAATGFEGWKRDLLDGFKGIRKRPVLVTILLTVAIADFGFAGALNTGLPLLVQARGWEAIGLVIYLEPSVWGLR